MYDNFDVIKGEADAPYLMQQGLAELRAYGAAPASNRTWTRFLLQGDDLLNKATVRTLCRNGANVAGARPLDIEKIFSHNSGYADFTDDQKNRAKSITLKEYVPYFTEHGQIPSDAEVIRRLGLPNMTPRENLSELAVRFGIFVYLPVAFITTCLLLLLYLG